MDKKLQKVKLLVMFGPKYVYGVPGNQYYDSSGKPTNGATTRLPFTFTVLELMINMLIL